MFRLMNKEGTRIELFELLVLLVHVLMPLGINNFLLFTEDSNLY